MEAFNFRTLVILFPSIFRNNSLLRQSPHRQKRPVFIVRVAFALFNLVLGCALDKIQLEL